MPAKKSTTAKKTPAKKTAAKKSAGTVKKAAGSKPELKKSQTNSAVIPAADKAVEKIIPSKKERDERRRKDEVEWLL